MSGSHYAIAPDGDDYTYDLRTLPEREADELAALRVEVARLADALNYANGRIDEQGREIAVLQTAVARLADALTVIQLREGL